MATPRVKIIAQKSSKFRSGLEQLVDVLLTKAHLTYDYESTKLPYNVPESKSKYLPDFRIMGIQHPCIFLEVKGRFTTADRKKMRLIKEQYPHMILIMVFGRSENTLTKQSSTTYGQWCDKHDILWCDINEFKLGPKQCLLKLLKKKNKNENYLA